MCTLSLAPTMTGWLCRPTTTVMWDTPSTSVVVYQSIATPRAMYSRTVPIYRVCLLSRPVVPETALCRSRLCHWSLDHTRQLLFGLLPDDEHRGGDNPRGVDGGGDDCTVWSLLGISSTVPFTLARRKGLKRKSQIKSLVSATPLTFSSHWKP